MKMTILEVRVEKNNVDAGTTLMGNVVLVNPIKAEAMSGIHLVLIGEEITSMKCGESTTSKTEAQPADPKFDRSKSIIIQTTIPVKNVTSGFFGTSRSSYPFEFKMPTDLPSTMVCRGEDTSAEIRYRLIACLTKNSGEPIYSKPAAVCVVAASIEKESRPMNIPLEQFPVKHCCFIDQGKIIIGWGTETTVGAPGSSIVVDIVGKNDSVVPIHSFVASWDEVVTLMCNGKSKAISRTLASAESFPTTKLWDPVARVPSEHLHASRSGIESLLQNRLSLKLLLPSDARDSCQGSLITVQHVLSVKVVTTDCCTDSPESSIEVLVQREMITKENERSKRHHGNAVVRFTETPTIAPMVESEIEQSPALVVTDYTSLQIPARNSPEVASVEAPLADAKLVETSNSSFVVTSKDAMTNTVKPTSTRPEKPNTKSTRRWMFTTRKKKSA